MAKFKGQLEDAQLHNKSTDPTNLPDGLVWLNTTDNKAKVYAGGAKRSIVTEDQTQTLTNKTLTSPAITTPTGLVKGDVGLGNVDNTSDATKNSATVALTNKTIDADLNTITNIENADIKAAANIAHSKMAALTASRAMVTDGSGVASASSVTSTELGYVSGVTSGIQAQINSHTGNTSNPHNVTAAQVGNSTAQWNANKLQGVSVSSSSPATNDTLKYNGTLWAPTAPSFYVTTASKTANYTATTSDDFIMGDTSVGGALLTITLPSVSTCTGKVLRIKKICPSNTYAVRIKGNGTDNIEDTNQIDMWTKGEQFVLASDGTVWRVLDHEWDWTWQDGGTLSVTGTSVNPTKGTTSRDKIWWRRVGDSAHFRIEFNQTAIGSGANGSGDYLVGFPAPTAMFIDTNKILFYSTTEGRGEFDAPSGVGTAAVTFGTSNHAMGMIVPYDALRFRIFFISDGAQDTTTSGTMGYWGSTWFAFGAGTFTIAADFTLPILNWSGK